jgi:hypothetical protein
MVFSDQSTAIQRDVSWTRGVRLISNIGALDVENWAFTCKLFSATGTLAKTIAGEIVADECALFNLTPEETGALPAGAGRWEIWAIRPDDYKMCLVKGRATII